MYDLMMLGLIAILVASEGALTYQYGMFLLLYGAIALVFLVVGYPVSESLSRRLVNANSKLQMCVSVFGVVVMTLFVSTVAFLVLPQKDVVSDARPLPSRLDLTAGRPLPPSQVLGDNPAPWAQFLPSRIGGGPVSTEANGDRRTVEREPTVPATPPTVSAIAPTEGPASVQPFPAATAMPADVPTAAPTAVPAIDPLPPALLATPTSKAAIAQTPVPLDAVPLNNEPTPTMPAPPTIIPATPTTVAPATEQPPSTILPTATGVPPTAPTVVPAIEPTSPTVSPTSTTVPRATPTAVPLQNEPTPIVSATPTSIPATVATAVPTLNLPAQTVPPLSTSLPATTRAATPAPTPAKEQPAPTVPPMASIVPATTPKVPAASGQPAPTVPPVAAGVPTTAPPVVFIEEVSNDVLGPSKYRELGYQGDAGDDVVMYVRSPLASYWRGQVLDEYDGRGWKPSASPGSNWGMNIVMTQGGRLGFSDGSPLMGLGDSYLQTFFLKVRQPDAVFTGYSPAHTIISKPTGGSSLGERLGLSIESLREAETYRMVSAVPALTPVVLRSDFADRSYLVGVSVPQVPSRVRELAATIVAGAPTDYDMAARLEAFLIDNYKYDLRVPPLSRSNDVVDTFLFERHAGYCAQFATTMAVMARLVGLPARVATGYLPGSYSQLTGAHTVRLDDAHAWVEIKFKRFGWVPFDPTPRPDSPWSLDVGYAGATSSLQQTLRRNLQGLFGGSGFSAAATMISPSQWDWRAMFYGPAVVLIVAVTITGLASAVRRRVRTGPKPGGYTLLQDAQRVLARRNYQRALRVLERKGYPKRWPSQSPEEYVETLEHLGHPVPEAFRQISRHASHALYDPSPLEPTVTEMLQRELRTLRNWPRLRQAGDSVSIGDPL